MSDIANLLTSAAESGDITTTTANLLTNAATLREIKKGDGVSTDTYQHSAVRIITILLDDSTSIEQNGNTPHLIDGHNLIIQALRGASKKQQFETIVSCRTLNNGPMYAYKHLADVPKLTTATFTPGGATPLFDQSIVTVGSVIAKVQEFENAGKREFIDTEVAVLGSEEEPGFTGVVQITLSSSSIPAFSKYQTDLAATAKCVAMNLPGYKLPEDPFTLYFIRAAAEKGKNSWTKIRLSPTLPAKV
jgi:hypothetical protein